MKFHLRRIGKKGIYVEIYQFRLRHKNDHSLVPGIQFYTRTGGDLFLLFGDGRSNVDCFD
ncbi:hypothetical protein [Methylomonas sp. CM2]|uniref:hypothetical protein n=1 Tax=Methylomonas sp. CM2 TaxID=3417647 RepID=UPI003CED673F